MNFTQILIKMENGIAKNYFDKERESLEKIEFYFLTKKL